MPDAAPEMMATLPANLMTVSPFVSLGRLPHQEKAGLSGPSELGTGHRREDNSRLTLAPPDLRIGGFLRWRAVQIKLRGGTPPARDKKPFNYLRLNL
jgi:hypothetical protein